MKHSNQPPSFLIQKHRSVFEIIFPVQLKTCTFDKLLRLVIKVEVEIMSVFCRLQSPMILLTFTAQKQLINRFLLSRRIAPIVIMKRIIPTPQLQRHLLIRRVRCKAHTNNNPSPIRSIFYTLKAALNFFQFYVHVLQLSPSTAHMSLHFVIVR